MKTIKKVEAYTLDEAGEILYKFPDVWAHWATEEKQPALGIYFNLLGNCVQITIPISELWRTFPDQWVKTANGKKQIF